MEAQKAGWANTAVRWMDSILDMIMTLFCFINSSPSSQPTPRGLTHSFPPLRPSSSPSIGPAFCPTSAARAKSKCAGIHSVPAPHRSYSFPSRQMGQKGKVRYEHKKIGKTYRSCNSLMVTHSTTIPFGLSAKGANTLFGSSSSPWGLAIT